MAAHRSNRAERNLQLPAKLLGPENTAIVNKIQLVTVELKQSAVRNLLHRCLEYRVEKATLLGGLSV